MLDKRYKVTEEIVLKLLHLKSEGWTMQQLANKFNISVSTVWYWSNAEYRDKQREKNRKRMAATEHDKAKAREYARARYQRKSRLEHMRDRIKRSIRENNYYVYGKKRSYWQAQFPEYFENISSAKLDGVL